MGAGQSVVENQPPSRALHVLRVTPSSPAAQTNIEPFFDFVIGFEGSSLSSDSQNNIDVGQLEKIVETHEDKVLNLLVWSSKNQYTRVVPIVPSRAWSQSKEPDPEYPPSLLGLSMRICQPEFALDNVWHVLDVIEGSPAESAGLVPYGDYIIGWSGGALTAEHEFYDLVEAHVDKPLRVYVYSHDFDALREVVLMPNRHWGGEGLLGCIFGYGLLHRIPAQEEREGMLLPSELQEPEDEDDNHKTFIPADVPISHDDAFIHNPSQQSLRTSLATVSETDNTASEDEDEEATFDRSVGTPRISTPLGTAMPRPMHNFFYAAGKIDGSKQEEESNDDAESTRSSLTSVD